MSHQDSAVSATLSFETNGVTTPPKILHKIASGIRGDGLKISRIAIFEKPFTARIYIKDTSSQQKERHRFLAVFMTVPDPDEYDYIVCLSIRVLPFFKQTCSFSIERRSYFQSRKSSLKNQYAPSVTHIRQSVSESILDCFKTTGAKILAAPSASRNTAHMLRKTL